ncbi:hypothetical protein [Nafulsella turpanensis]|uniref:hypothetical protein n=1 Tax=Nafulsella turpanensis TaxID=1265690 RepID=UPI0012698702|nr:hypothetical protein [Nafulsella turpanensis]
MKIHAVKQKFRLLLLISLGCLGSHNIFAQADREWSVEQLVLSDGSTQELSIYYDAYLELLHYKDVTGNEQRLMPEEVISFSFQGDQYFSIPFKNGKLSFFKVEYEGKDIALLSKSNSVNLIQYLSSAYVDRYQICPGKGKKSPIQLCEINLSGQFSALSGHPAKTRPEQLSVKHCLFVVGEQGLRLFRMEVEKTDFLLGKRIRTVYFESLDELLDPDRLEQAHDYALSHDLDEDKLEDLVHIFRYYTLL